MNTCFAFSDFAMRARAYLNLNVACRSRCTVLLIAFLTSRSHRHRPPASPTSDPSRAGSPRPSALGLVRGIPSPRRSGREALTSALRLYLLYARLKVYVFKSFQYVLCFKMKNRVLFCYFVLRYMHLRRNTIIDIEYIAKSKMVVWHRVHDREPDRTLQRTVYEPSRVGVLKTLNLVNAIRTDYTVYARHGNAT